MLTVGVAALIVLSLILSFAVHEIMLDRRRRKARRGNLDLRRRRL